jgi:hypothetical protein
VTCARIPAFAAVGSPVTVTFRLATREVKVVLPFSRSHRFVVPLARIPAFARLVAASWSALGYRMAAREVEVILPLAGTHRFEMPRLRVPAFARHIAIRASAETGRAATREIEVGLPSAGADLLEVTGTRIPAFFRAVGLREGGHCRASDKDHENIRKLGHGSSPLAGNR